MSTLNLRTLLTSAAMAAGLALAGPAIADEQIGPNASDFRIDEVSDDGLTFYQVTNNSDDWYIYAFAITNVGGEGPFANRDEWNADYFCTGSFCGDGYRDLGFVQLNGYGFGFQSGFYNPGSFVGSIFGNPINPNELSTFEFGFYGSPQSEWQMQVFNVRTQEFSTVFGSANAVPEPATWALMIGGFGLAGAALRRRRVVAA